MCAMQSPTGTSETVDARVAGFGISYAITSLLNALIVILKESSEAVHDAFAAVTGHHWVTHGLLDVIVFIVLGYLFSRRDMHMAGNTLISIVVGATVVSGLIIAGYFI